MLMEDFVTPQGYLVLNKGSLGLTLASLAKDLKVTLLILGRLPVLATTPCSLGSLLSSSAPSPLSRSCHPAMLT